jgi:hypothetical protein
MANPEIRTLPVAVRVFPEDLHRDRNSRSGRFWREPEGILLIHTEPRGRKRGFVGTYRFLMRGELAEEGLFYGHLSNANVRLLKNYTKSHTMDAVEGRMKPLKLFTLSEFLKLFYDLAYKARCLVVGFNLAVHLSRLAFSAPPARNFFDGGFSLGLWTYIDRNGRERPNGYRPRVCVKYVDRKRALIGFTARNSPDEEDLIPEGSGSGEPRPGYRFPGHFLDVRTLAHALADELYSLEAACKAFGVNYE